MITACCIVLDVTCLKIAEVMDDGGGGGGVGLGGGEVQRQRPWACLAPAVNKLLQNICCSGDALR